MEFLSKMEETTETKKLKEVIKELNSDIGEGFRMFERVRPSSKSNIELSIQASYQHYCTPKKTVDIEDYTTMELAIMRKKTFLNIFDLCDDPVLVTKLRRCYEGSIYGFVPVEIIEEVYQGIKQGEIK